MIKMISDLYFPKSDFWKLDQMYFLIWNSEKV